MGIELIAFREGKGARFEEDILHFASDRYNCKLTRNWKVMLAHVDPAAWIDLFRVSRHSAMEAGAEDWSTCDAWTLTWDFLTPVGWIHADQPLREQFVARIELDRFDPVIAQRAARYDLVTFLQDDLLHCIAKVRKIPEYEASVICHETMHTISDWTGKELVRDGVPPSEDTEVAATLNAYIKHIGGWKNFKQRYLL